MAQTSVAQFATSLKMPAGALLEQLQKAKAHCLSANSANEKLVADYERQKTESKPADKIA